MSTSRGNDLAFHCLAQLRLQSLYATGGLHEQCLDQSSFPNLAQVPFSALSPATRKHLASCSCCSAHYASTRGKHLARHLPDSWHSVLTDLSSNDLGDGTVVLHASLSLESLKCEPRHSDDQFIRPCAIQVRLVITSDAGLASLSLTGVPESVSDIWLYSPLGQFQLFRSDEEDGWYDTDIDLAEEGICAEHFILAANQGSLRLSFTAQGEFGHLTIASDLLLLLHRFDVIEREFDYLLPCGLVSDTHINASKVCEQDCLLDAVASIILNQTRNLDFDVVLSNGWAMDMVAQRLLVLRSRQGLPAATNVMCVGYSPVTMLGDIVAGNRVLILLDVIVTGGQVRDLQNIVREFGGRVAGIRALCSADSPKATDESLSFGLCVIPMKIAEGSAATASEKEQRVFNPFSHCMTTKAGGSRSPTAFLSQNADAAEFWLNVDRTNAYEHHHVERGAHYIAFINTLKLINDSSIGDALVQRLAQKVTSASGMPDCVLVPDRIRARELAERSVRCWSVQGRTTDIVVASYRGGAWQVASQDLRRLARKKVMVIDSAVGYGRTVDQLVRMAHAHGAVQCGAAVLISRLPHGAEAAFNRRLNGGLISLYSLPIQPVVIRAHRRALCPICRHKDALNAAASLSGDEAIERWAKWLSRPPKWPQSGAVSPRRAYAQLRLFPQSETTEFFVSCSGRVASGVTLHALNAARSNGMAPLALPELTNSEIPAVTRAAMLRHLPDCVLEWNTDLERDIEDYLSCGDSSSVWQAAAEVLSRERKRHWVEHLSDFIRKCRRVRSQPAPLFWSSMACNAYIVSAGEPEYRTYLEESLVELRSELSEGCAHEGLEIMLHAVRRHDKSTGATDDSRSDYICHIIDDSHADARRLPAKPR